MSTPYTVATTTGPLSSPPMARAHTEADARLTAASFSKSDFGAWTWGIYLHSQLIATYYNGSETPLQEITQ